MTVLFAVVGSAVGSAIYLAGRAVGFKQGFDRGVAVGTIASRTIVYSIRRELRGILAFDEHGASIAHGFDPLMKAPKQNAAPAGDAGSGS